MNYQKELEKSVIDNQKDSGLKTILIIDGEDKRAIKAAELLSKNKLVEPILLTKNKIENTSVKQHIFNETEYQEFVEKFVELRKGKETLEAAQKQMSSLPFYGTMLLKLNKVDGVIGGLNYPTADILRAAFKIIGPTPGIKTISSVMIVHKEEQKFLFSDISVNIAPTVEQLVDIAKNANDFALQLGFDPQLAFLSFSTSRSAVAPQSELVEKASQIYNESATKKALGEIQFDAALDEAVRSQKYKGELPKSNANVLIFPNLDAGNIGYKIAQRLGGYGAIGPIITGIASPINDLSRGATVEDIYNTALITALQAKGDK
ncbi:phosphotransacetylase [Mesomycoplasma conjunctivae]|nr:phosphate acetyltransferase [Mesomycoplasma conjunctivae]VEU65793.1 phosphotransacetylase [Mesomycoplasma conjunctivae]